MMTRKEKKWLFVALIVCICLIVGILVLEQKTEKVVQKRQEDIAINSKKTVYNLPLVTIDVPNENIDAMKAGVDHQIKTGKATIKVYDNSIHKNQLSQKPTQTYHAYINIRGNSTKLVPKKQYKIKLMDKDFKKKEKAQMLGMPEADEWVLNAPFEDKSLIRNVLAYDVGREIMPWAPRTRFCEVFIRQKGDKGEMDEYYRGVYVMIEPIKRGKDRVNIDKTDNNAQTSFIVQKNNQNGETHIVDSFGKENYLYDYPFIVEYPKSKLTQKKEEYIAQTLSMFEHSLYKTKKDNEYEKYIDVDSFVDYFIINEFFNNTDAGLLSTFMYKDYGSKIYAGPIWDFNASLGNSNLISPYYDYTGFYMSRTPLFDKLLEHKEFVNKVINRYHLLRQTYLRDEVLLKQVDYLVKSLGAAPQRNFKVWPIWLCNQYEMFKEYDDVFLPLGTDVDKIEDFLNQKKNKHYLKDTENMATSYKEEIKKLKVFIVNRGKWMDDNINDLKDLANEKNEGNE